jgi:hypothetical protein
MMSSMLISRIGTCPDSGFDRASWCRLCPVGGTVVHCIVVVVIAGALRQFEGSRFQSIA